MQSHMKLIRNSDKSRFYVLKLLVPVVVVGVFASLEQGNEMHSYLKWDTAARLQWQIDFHKFSSQSGWRRSKIFRHFQMAVVRGS